MKRNVLSFLFVLLFSSYVSSENMTTSALESKLYSNAKISLQNRRWKEAINQLEIFESRFPHSSYLCQVSLDAIFAYYKHKDYGLSLATIDRFILMNPAHERVDWVLYMRGLSHTARYSHTIYGILGIDYSDRDPTLIKRALFDFEKLTQHYPSSFYAPGAHELTILARKRLARYHCGIASFYLHREAWIAALHRCQIVQQIFPNTQEARDSFLIQLKAYKGLGAQEAFVRTKKLIGRSPR